MKKKVNNDGLSYDPETWKSATAEEVEAARNGKRGWTAKALRKWGIPWPPPAGWKKVITGDEPSVKTGNNLLSQVKKPSVTGDTHSSVPSAEGIYTQSDDYVVLDCQTAERFLEKREAADNVIRFPRLQERKYTAPEFETWSQALLWALRVIDDDDHAIAFLAGVLAAELKIGMTEKQAFYAENCLNRVVRAYENGVLKCQERG